MAAFGVKFWGTRGLISSPRIDTAVFGGNTPCIQIFGSKAKNQLLVIDSGFGIANLGEQLLPGLIESQDPLQVHIFYTHFHWDHIQGLPFFKAIYFPTTELHLYSPAPRAETLSNLNILFDGSYSPFESLLKMPAKVHIHQLQGPQTACGMHVTYQAVDHGGTELTTQEGEAPHAAYAYRISTDERESLCIVTDHEARPGIRNDAVVKFVQGTDLLIHDSQYLPAEYAKHVGWGHSSTLQALENALRVQPGKLLLTHHDPSRTDNSLMREHAELTHDKRFASLDFEFAREEIDYAVSRRVPFKSKKAG